MNKNTRKSARILAGSITALLALSSLPAPAATQTWDTDGNALNGQNGIITGIWNTSLPYWWDGVSTYGAWVNGNDAIFTGGTYNNTAGIVNISGTVSANSVKFNSGNNYIISGETLNLTGSAQIGGSNSGIINAQITSTVGLSKIDSNTVTLQGYNTYTGATTISAGTLQVIDGVAGLSTLSNVTLTGGILETADDLIRASGSGASQMQLTSGTTGFSAVPVQTILPGAPNRINATNGANAIVVAMGTLASPDALTWGSGSFTPGTLVLNGNGVWLDFRNAIDLNGAGRTVNSSVGDNANNVAIMSGVISGGAGSGLTKSGTGRVALSAANTYAGATTISTGTIIMRNANALGSTGAGNGTSVASGASLALEGSIVTAAEDVTLNGTGVSGNLKNIAGNNTFSGAISLGANAQIASAVGRLTIGTIALGASQTVTLGHTGDTGILLASGVISGATGAVTVNGAAAGNNQSAVILSGANTFGGTTTIGSGRLRAVDGVGLPTASNLVMNATLETSGTFTRTLGNTSGQQHVSVQSGGSFSAVGGSATIGYLVSGSGSSDPANAANKVTWGGTFFNPGSTFTIQGSQNSNGILTVVNAIDLGTGTPSRTITTGTRNGTLDNNFPLATAIISGGISGTGNLTIGGNSSQAAFPITVSGNLSHTGTLTIGNHVGHGVILSGNNTFAPSSQSAASPAVTVNTTSANFTSGGLFVNSATAFGATNNFVKIADGAVIDNTSGSAVVITNNYNYSFARFQFKGTSPLDLGPGTVTITSNQWALGPAMLTVSGTIQGTTGLESTNWGGQGTGGYLTLKGNNTFGGASQNIRWDRGQLNIGHASALGNAANTLQLQGGLWDNTSGAALTLANNYAQLWDAGGLTAFFTDAADSTHDLNMGTGAVNMTGARTLTVNGAGTLTIGGLITSGQTLTKSGRGTLVMSANNPTNGTTFAATVNRGTLTLDYSTNNNSKITDGSTLTLGGGTVNLKGGTHAEIVNATNLNAGGSAIVQSGGGSATLNMGSITRNAGAILDVSAGDIALTGTGTASTLLTATAGAYATVGGTDWAAKNAGNTAIVAYSTVGSYNLTTATALGGVGNQSDVDTGVDTTLAADASTSTLRFNQNEARTIDVNGKTVTLTQGGILVTSNVNPGAGTSTITGGTLKAGSNNSLQIIQNSSKGLTIGSLIANGSSASALVKGGSGTLILTGANSYTGVTYVSGGTLQIGDGGATGQLGAGSVTNNAVLTFNRTGSITVANAIDGYGDLVQGGPAGSSVILTADNTYTGNTIVNANTTLQVGSGGGTGRITQNNSGSTLTSLGQNNGTVQVNGTLTFNRTGTATVDALITGAGILNQGSPTGANVLVLTANGGASTFSGATTVTGGILRADDGLGLSKASSLTLNGGIWEAYNTGSGISASYAHNLFRAGGSSAGQMRITGGTSGFSAGTLNSTNVGFGSFASPESLTWGSGNFQPSTLVLNETTATKYLYFWNPIDLNGSPRTVAVNATYTAASDTKAAYMSGVLSGTGGLTKSGGGVLGLNATNTYTGTTAVNAGVLRADENVGLPGTASAGGGSNLTLNGGVWESQFDMTRAGGTGQGQMQITGGVSGFSASILTASNALNPMNVAFGSYASPGSVQWGSATFNPSTLVLNALSANNKLNFLSAIDLNGSTRQIGSLAAAYNLNSPDDKTATISGVISGTGSSSALTMPAGFTGAIALAGNNTYEGATTISSGMLVMRHGNALGSTSVGTTVNSGGSLGLEGGIVTAAEPLSINGSGGTGALRNLWGNNTYSGPITLAGNAVIQSDNGTLTLNGSTAIDLTSKTLTLGSGNTGNGNIIITSQITGTGGNVTRVGDGTNFVWLNPSVANTYSGTTLINAQNSPTYLRAVDGVGLPTTSVLQIGNGAGRSVFETSGTFTRTLGNTAGQQQVVLNNGNAGFAAVNGSATVGFLVQGSGSADPTAAANKVIWGGSGVNQYFNPNGFVIADTNSNANLTFVNTFDLNGGTRVFSSLPSLGVNDPSVTTTFSGGITNTTGTATLQMDASNSRRDPNIVFSGPISGNMNVNTGKDQSNNFNWQGSVTLSGDNSFVGTIRLSIWDAGDGRNINYLNHAHALGAASNTVALGVSGQQVFIDNTSGADIVMDRSYAYNNNVGGQGTGTVNFVGTYGLDMGPGSWTLAQTNNTINVYKKTFTVAALLGAGQSVTVNNNGTNNYGVFAVTGSSTYNGTTSVKGGVFRAVDGVGLPNTSSTNGGSYLNLNGGVWESSANMVRIGGTGQGQMQITSGTSGFSANGAAVSVAFSATASLGSPDSLTWGAGNFSPGTLVLNEYTANNTLNFVNPVDFNGSQRTVNVNAGAANAATMSGVLSGTGGSGLTKGGVGTLILSNSNTYAGATTVNVGTLKLGAAGDATNTPLGTTVAGTTVSATGAALDLGGFTLGTAEALSITGTGLSASVGALTNSGGAAVYSGVVTLGSGGASVGGSGDIELSAGLATNANALTKVGADILTLSAGSSRTGATTLSAGTINQSANNALGISNPALSILPTTGTGLYNMTGAVAQTVGLLTLGGANGTTASITTGTGTLTMGGNLTYSATNNPNGATISGLLNLGTTQKTFDIGESSAATNDLTVTADVSNGGGGSILKTGLGTLRLDGAQGYDTLTVNDGTTNVNGALTTLTAAVTVNDTPGGNPTKLRFGSVSQTLSSLTIGAGATVVFTSGTATGSVSGGGGGGKAAGFGSGASGTAAVPEPGTLGLLLVGALGVLNRRRRRA